MLYLAQHISRSEIERSSSMLELFQATTRKLLLLSGLFWILGALFASARWDEQKIIVLLGGILILGLIYWPPSGSCAATISPHWGFGWSGW